MKYGSVTLNVLFESLNEITGCNRQFRQYIGTDVSDVADLGRSATVIMMTLIARSADERILYQQMLHSTNEAVLELGGHYYKRVVPSQDANTRKINATTWRLDAQFTALDPIPYSTATNERLY